MSLLKQLIQEIAAAGSTGANSIAGARGSLFGGGVVDLKQAHRRQKRLMKRMLNYTVVGEGFDISPPQTVFDPSDVISKLDDAEKKAKNEKDTVTFGLEDEDGNLVKVYVKAEQAEEFEHALAVALSGQDEDEDDENSAVEIAEVLFDLKDKFEIVDVEWPTIEGDEEEEQEVVGDKPESGETDLDLEGGEPEGGEPEGGEPEGGEPEGGETDLDLEGGETEGGEMTADEESAKSALQQVIDVLKADADAKQAEAKAKEAEAKAKEAEFASKSAEAKVKQEEEILDMETYYKDKAEQRKEAKQLAKLAKYKHDKARDAETSLSYESFEPETTQDCEEKSEEDKDNETTISADELAELIFKNLRANS